MECRTNKKFIAAFFFLLLLLSYGSSLAGSIFSRSGIGLPRYGISTMAIGMGGIGMANANRNTLPYLNPAGLSFIDLTRFEGSFYFENADVTFSGDEARFSRATFNSFQVVFPVKNGFGLGIGLLPFSTASYKFSRTVDFDESSALESLTGSGGLERGFIQVGGKISNWLAIGAGFDVYFGRLEKTWRLIFDNPEYTSSIDEISSYIDGIGGHAGLFLNIGKYVDAGAVFYFPTTLEAETKTIFRFGEQTERQISNVKVPFSHGYGLTIVPNARFQAGVDLFLQSWSGIEPEDFLATQTENTFRLGFGISYQPSNALLAGFFSRMTYRLGFNTSTLPYVSNSGEQLRENLLAFGFSVPFNFNISKIDFGFEYGKRGSLDVHNAEETVFRFVVGITGGEKWFVRR